MKISMDRKLSMVAILSTILITLIGNNACALAEVKLTASDGAAWDRFGCSVSIDGERMVVGAFGDNSGSGSAYVFRYDGTDWVQEGKLTPSDGATGDYFGYSVSISGDRVVVGAYGDDTCSGSAYVFRYDGKGWIEVAKLTASDGAVEDYFGYVVSVSGGSVVIGAVGDDDRGTHSGSPMCSLIWVVLTSEKSDLENVILGEKSESLAIALVRLKGIASSTSGREPMIRAVTR
jgi:hypothetical protein